MFIPREWYKRHIVNSRLLKRQCKLFLVYVKGAYIMLHDSRVTDTRATEIAPIRTKNRVSIFDSSWLLKCPRGKGIATIGVAKRYTKYIYGIIQNEIIYISSNSTDYCVWHFKLAIRFASDLLRLYSRNKIDIVVLRQFYHIKIISDIKYICVEYLEFANLFLL